MIGHLPRECNNGKGMLSSVEQAFVGREEIRAPLKTPAWEATIELDRVNPVLQIEVDPIRFHPDSVDAPFQARHLPEICVPAI